jgi:hypothetical protein
VYGSSSTSSSLGSWFMGPGEDTMLTIRLAGLDKGEDGAGGDDGGSGDL